MAQRISSTPCDASGCEAAPLLDVEKGVPEEHGTASPADDGGVETSGCRRFFQGFLAVVWLFMVNQMRKDYSACDNAETRPVMALLMVVIAFTVANVFHLISTQPAYPPA
ncbi:hypothetical protein TRIUR3_06491 [Triticum urartu]|uniref:Uncharacterized protein n=2 Tax=Triticum TaxID=4564 RepID=A0A9R0SHK7_TRITD|nr:uncharacterized protein LOC125550659 [Triticum urartu]EMS45178.1 hypothetical protein TRIUR3_06491 [Triticum urartu]VAH94263.1 unnamed protein product [Triticum turgidum subsp. durum]